MIRAILALLFAVLYLILGIPVLIVEWIIGKFNKKVMDVSSLRMVQWAFRVIMFICGVKLTVKGDENVPKDEPVLYICNHKSYFDIIITYSRCPNLTGYISKDTLGKVPLLNIWMKRLYCLFLDRKDIKQGLKTILTAIDYVKQGVSMCIFPEGTRNTSENLLLPFKAGSFKIAEKTNCTIIPMAITNSADILENHFPKVKPTHVVLQYGKPIHLKDLSKEEQKHLASYVQKDVEALLLDNQTMLS
ncbi:MAG: lysophospholipid acyltransferase family protein [Lachnospiraceae bacterium]|nr:lysophospholipid acyltransferase family protein [Lachnospiraceae bacterium]